jgi:hypothetical protein
VSYLVFETPGLIDMRAFTTMGISAKPRSALPIGMFGTGLKYAMAVLVRMGVQPVVYVGKDKYTFAKKQVTFRDKGFDLLRMRAERFSLMHPRWIDLPYTTEYGRNWKMWQVFRELEANTRDENGTTSVQDQQYNPKTDCTAIVIDSSDLIAEWQKRDEIFLPDAARTGDGVEVRYTPCDRVYWRGLRVHELNKPALFTYNFLGWLELTEDRTLKYEFYATSSLAKWLLTDCTDEQIIETILTAPSRNWEHGLSFDNYNSPSDTFRRVMDARPKGISSGVHQWWGRHDTRSYAATKNVWDVHPLPWSVSEDQTSVIDADGTTVFDEPSGYQGRWNRVGEKIVEMVNVTMEPAT